MRSKVKVKGQNNIFIIIPPPSDRSSQVRYQMKGHNQMQVKIIFLSALRSRSQVKVKGQNYIFARICSFSLYKFLATLKAYWPSIKKPCRRVRSKVKVKGQNRIFIINPPPGDQNCQLGYQMKAHNQAQVKIIFLYALRSTSQDKVKGQISIFT